MQRGTCRRGGSCKEWGKKLDEHRSWAGRTVQSPIVLSDEGNEDEDDTGRLSELIALAEVGLQAEEDDDTFFT